MRDYTYIEGYRYSINNIYRSERYDVDRLDLNYADEDKPKFVRGFRVVDHQADVTVTLDGEDGDNLAYSMAFVSCSNKEYSKSHFDTYLEKCLVDGDYLISNHKTVDKSDESPVEEVLH
jgi:hypothetical protein